MGRKTQSGTLPTLGQEIGKKRPFEVAEEEAFLNIVRTACVLTSGTHRFFKRFGLSEAQYSALRILRGHGAKGVACQTIGEELVAQVPDVTRLVDRLVEAKWAERERTEEDRRVVMVRITKQGLDVLGRVDRPLAELHREQLGHLSRGDLRGINELMVKARRGSGDDVRRRCPA